MSVKVGSPKKAIYSEVNRLAQVVDAGGGGGSGAVNAMTAIEVNSLMWAGNTAPYTLTIMPESHGLGAHSNLYVALRPKSGTIYTEYYDSPSISEDGTITVKSNSKWAGKVLISGGSVSLDLSSAIVQTTGQNSNKTMSQKAITDLLNDANNTFARKDGEYVDMVVGKAIMAQVDDNGEYIPDKYAKKTELPNIKQNGVKKTTVNFVLSGTTLNITVE